MNISSTNYGAARITRYRDDSVTICDTRTGHARSFAGGWNAWQKLQAELLGAAKSADEFRAAVEARLLSI